MVGRGEGARDVRLRAKLSRDGVGDSVEVICCRDAEGFNGWRIVAEGVEVRRKVAALGAVGGVCLFEDQGAGCDLIAVWS